jgi:uncharacterized protein (TIGR03437 family)
MAAALVLAFSALAADAASPALSLQVSTETAPAGGWAQVKVTAASPELVGAGALSMDFDPSVFGNIAQVAVFSAGGDAIGYANVSGQHVDAHFSSPSAGIAQLPGLPVFSVWVPILAGAAPGATTSVTVDPTLAPWTDNQGNTVTVTAVPATFTVGGSLSVAGVTPGGGLLPEGTVVQVTGTGFDATTTVAIDGVAISSQMLKNPQEIDVALGGATDLTGKHFHIANAAGAQVDCFSALPSLPSPPPSGYTAITGVQLLLPSATYTAYGVGNFLEAQGHINFGIGLLNQTLAPVSVALIGVGTGGIQFQQTLLIPANTLYLLEGNQILLSTGTLVVQSPVPIHILDYRLVDSPPVAPYAILSSPAPPPYGPIWLATLGPGYVEWNWTIGDPQPAATNLTVDGAYGFTVSTSGEPWLSVAPLQGTGPATLTVTPKLAGLAPGQYSSTITVTPVLPPLLAGFLAEPATCQVTLTVTSPNSIGASGYTYFLVHTGNGQPQTGSLAITSNGAPLPFTISIAPAAAWLTVSPLSGTTPATLALTATWSAQPVGLYATTLTIQGPNNTLTIPVQFQVNPVPTGPTLDSASSLSAVEPTGVSARTTGSLAVTTGPYDAVITNVTAQTQSGGNWLTAQTECGSCPIVSAYVSTVGLAPGTYQGTIEVDSSNYGSTLTSVTLTVLPAPSAPAVNPPSLSLTAPAGQTATGSFNVSAASGPVLFEVGGTFAVSVESAPTPGAGPGEYYLTPATVAVSASAPLPGTYYGSANIIWANGTVTVPVVLYATATAAAPPLLSSVVSGGSLKPGAISPGELISIFGDGVGPAPAGLTLTSEGKVATTLSGTLVLIDGVPAPLTYASTGQVNAVVPYEAGTSGVATIEVVSDGGASAIWGVPLAPAAPAIFTGSATGQGQGAVVNQDTSINGPANPAPRGTVVSIYATGEGLTTPAGITGSVTAGVIMPQLPVTVKIGGLNAQVMWAGSAPDDVAGVLQVNAVVPMGVSAGPAVPVEIAVGGAPSQGGVTMAVE